jgi:circadian clock protein KaiB
MTSSDTREPAPAATPTRLTLYVAGESTRSNQAVENLRRLLESPLSGPYELAVVDVLRHPELAERERVLATPTLLKQFPPPRRRIIGDLSDIEQLMGVLAPDRGRRDTGPPHGSNGLTTRHLR